MSFFIFLIYYFICSCILLFILYFIFKKYLSDKLLKNVIKEAFDNKDVDIDLVSVTDILNDMSSSINNSKTENKESDKNDKMLQTHF